MMKKYLMLLVSLSVLPVFAAELQDWKSGKPQDLQALPGQVKVVNIWATWCVPCRKEMPAMSAWYQKQDKKKVSLVGIAVDKPDNIGSFLKQTPVSYPVWHYAGNDSRAFMKMLGNAFGGVPYTMAYAEKCDVRQSIVGEVSSVKLDEAVKAVRSQCKLS